MERRMRAASLASAAGSARIDRSGLTACRPDSQPSKSLTRSAFVIVRPSSKRAAGNGDDGRAATGQRFGAAAAACGAPGVAVANAPRMAVATAARRRLSLRCRDVAGNAKSPAALVLRGHEVFQHRLAHQVRRQQALAQDEVVEFPLLEFSPELAFGLLAQRQQARVAVEVAVGLPRGAIGEALHLLLGECVA